MWRPRYSQSFVSTKGLRNAPGENNCFLNSAIQVLWHLDVFRRSFRLLSGHVCMDNSCIFCALKVLFTQFQYSDQASLPPDAMRKALAQTFADQQRFQMGLMDDAAECLENILMRVHSHIAHMESEDMCNAPHCIPHQKFAMNVVEQVVCRCGATSEPLSFTQMVHYVSTRTLVDEWRYMIDHSREPQTDIFDQLLRTANARNDLRDCPSNCGQRVEIRRNLMNKPDVVCVGLVWDSDRPAPSHIMDVLRCIGTNLRLANVFHNAADAMYAKPLSLVGVVCYYGKHYSTFFYNTRLSRWIYFDDAAVREMGTDWSCVVDKCCRGHYQPLLLLYANHDADVINADTAPQYTTRIANQTLPGRPTDLGRVHQSSAYHIHQRSMNSSQSIGSNANTQRRSITPGPIRSDRDPVDGYEVEKRRAVTPGPDKHMTNMMSDYDLRSSMSDEQLAEKRAAAAMHVRQSSYLQAVDFPPPAHPGGAPNFVAPEPEYHLQQYKAEPDEGYYTQRHDHSRRPLNRSQSYDRQGQVDSRDNGHVRMENYDYFDRLDGSSFQHVDSKRMTYGNADKGQVERVVSTDAGVDQTDSYTSREAAESKEGRSLPPHKSRIAKAAAIQRKESFKRGNKIPADVIRFDVSDVPTNPGTKSAKKQPQVPQQPVQSAGSRMGPVEIGHEAVNWQYSKYKVADCRPVQTAHLPRSQSNFTLDTASRKPRRERRNTLHGNPMSTTDNCDLQKNSSTDWQRENSSESKQRPSDKQRSEPPPYEYILQQKPATHPHEAQSERQDANLPCPPSYDQTGRTLDSYLVSSQKSDRVKHNPQLSMDSTHNADQNRRAMEALRQQYHQRGLQVSNHGSSNGVSPRENHNQFVPSYKRETSVTDSDYNSGDRNSSSSNNSLPPLETKESRLAKQAAERMKKPPLYEHAYNMSKSVSLHNVDKFSDSSNSAHSSTSTLKNAANGNTEPPPGMEADVHELCCKAEGLMAESLQKEEQNDLAMAMCLCTQAVTYLKQAIQLDTCSYESHVYARMKHNTCVLRSRSLHRRIMMRQDSNTTGSEASDNISESSLQTDDSGLPVEFDHYPYGGKQKKSGKFDRVSGNEGKSTKTVVGDKPQEEPPYVSSLIKSWNDKLSCPTDGNISGVTPYSQVKGGVMEDMSSAGGKQHQVHQATNPVMPDSSYAGFSVGSKYGDFSIKLVDYNGRPLSNDVVSGDNLGKKSAELDVTEKTSTHGWLEQNSVKGGTTSAYVVKGARHMDVAVGPGEKATLRVTSSGPSYTCSTNVPYTDKRSLEIFGTLPRKRGNHNKQSSEVSKHSHQGSSSSSTPQHTRENSLDNSLDVKYGQDAVHVSNKAHKPTHGQYQERSLHPTHRRERSNDHTLQTSTLQATMHPNQAFLNTKESSARHSDSAHYYRPGDAADGKVYSSSSSRTDKHSRESSSDSTLQGSHHSRQSSSSSHASAQLSSKHSTHTHTAPHTSLNTNPVNSASLSASGPPPYGEIHRTQCNHSQTLFPNQRDAISSRDSKEHSTSSSSYVQGTGYSSYSQIPAPQPSYHEEKSHQATIPPPAYGSHAQSNATQAALKPGACDSRFTGGFVSSQHLLPQPQVAPSATQHRSAAASARGPKPPPPVRVSSIPQEAGRPAVSQQQLDRQSDRPQKSSVSAIREQLEQKQMKQFSSYAADHGSKFQTYTDVGKHFESTSRPGYQNLLDKQQQGADFSANNCKSIPTEGRGRYPVTGNSLQTVMPSSGYSAVQIPQAVYLGSADPAAASISSLPVSRKVRQSDGMLPSNVKMLSKSVKFCDQVVLVGAKDDMPQEQDYFSLVENLLSRRGKPPPRGSPMPSRRQQPPMDRTDADDNSDTGSSTSDSLDSGDKVRCNLCRKKHIAIQEMYCEACRHYLTRLGQSAAS